MALHEVYFESIKKERTYNMASIIFDLDRTIYDSMGETRSVYTCRY